MKNKSMILPMVLLIITIMILGFLSFIFFYNLKNGNPYTEEEFVDKLTSMGEDIYTNYYYKVTAEDKTEEEMKTFLKKFEVIGLQFNLVELEKYSEENSQVISKFMKTNKDCKKDQTMIIIYPKEPYGKTDFKSEVRMDCGYKKK